MDGRIPTFNMMDINKAKTLGLDFIAPGFAAISFFLFSSIAISADSTSGTSKATVIQPATITAVSNLTVRSSVLIPSVPTSISASDISTATTESITDNISTASGDEDSSLFGDTNFLGSPASFNVAGEPHQVFSIALPERGMILMDSSVIVISGFDHNGGLTPSVSGDGSGNFNVQAKFSVDDLDPQIDPIEPPGDTSSESRSTDDLSATPVNLTAGEGVEGSPVGQSNFEFAITTEAPHFDIIVSYN